MISQIDVGVPHFPTSSQCGLQVLVAWNWGSTQQTRGWLVRQGGSKCSLKGDNDGKCRCSLLTDTTNINKDVNQINHVLKVHSKKVGHDAAMEISTFEYVLCRWRAATWR